MLNRELLLRGGHDTSLEVASTREAAEFLSRRVSSSWNIASLLGKTIKAELLGEEGHQTIHITTPEREIGEVPRSTTSVVLSGIALSSAGNRMTLVAHVDQYADSPVLDRGLVWVDATGDIESVMSFVVRPEHGLSEQELETYMDTVFERGDAFVSGLLEGQPTPPYSEDYPVTASV